jgi:hypothetical protein
VSGSYEFCNAFVSACPAAGQRVGGGAAPSTNTLAVMHVIELTDEELRIARAALHAFLDDFGHEEADILQAVKAILAKLPDDT